MTIVVDHLMRLGLTKYEARAYVATVAIGEGTIKEISEESGVPRSRAYDVMERLAQKGFVEVGSSSPRCYRANEPITASNHLMEEIRRSNDEVLRELSKIGERAESRNNPIWTVKGEWAIDHKVSDILEGANSEVTILCFNNRNLIRYAKMITQLSEKKKITVVVGHQPEGFVGLLGKSRVMRIRPIPGFFTDAEGVLNEKGFVTSDGKYCIELVIRSDRDDSLLVTKEGEGRRAIVITGTILNFFSHQTVDHVVHSAEEVTKGRR
jgi:HTH-type transcriptional regulator, sugar sensing transcriptional regulator